VRRLQINVCSNSYWERPLLVKLIKHSCRTNTAVYEYSPFECMSIYAYVCLWYIKLCPTRPAGELPNLGQSLNLGQLLLCLRWMHWYLTFKICFVWNFFLLFSGCPCKVDFTTMIDTNKWTNMFTQCSFYNISLFITFTTILKLI